MKILVLANRDLAACSALNRLWPTLLAGHDVQLVLSSRVGRDGEDKPYGLRQLACVEQQYFNDFIFPLADSLPPEQCGPWLSFRALARQTGKPVLVMNRINEGDDYQQFAELAPDLVISIRYGVILKQAVLAVPRHGVINLHSGQLPGYRGVMASFWAMLNGEQELGTTLHFIDDDGIDTGRILAMTRLPIQAAKSYLWHVLALYEEGCRSILDAVTKIAGGEELRTRPQEGSGGYYSFPSEADLVEFQRRGFRLFDAEDLLRFSQQFVKSPPLAN